MTDGQGSDGATLALGASGVPYFSQWESAELATGFVDGSVDLADDPRWAASGARTPAEYRYWARKVCGLACLKMILAQAMSAIRRPIFRIFHKASNSK